MESSENLIDEFIEIDELNKDQFLQVKETLTRIGLPGRAFNNKKTLWQQCYVLHKQKRYFIVHHKQLQMLDGEDIDMNDDEYDMVEYVSALLQEWKLIEPLYQVEKTKTKVVVVPFSKKSDWIFKSKYNFGVKS